MNSLEMPQILLGEGVIVDSRILPCVWRLGLTLHTGKGGLALLFICFNRPKSLASFAVKSCGEAAVGGRFSIAPSLTYLCLEFNVCW